MRELQRAFKNPAANLGIIMGEGTKRAKRMVGMRTGQSLEQFVHPTLLESSNQVEMAGISTISHVG